MNVKHLWTTLTNVYSRVSNDRTYVWLNQKNHFIHMLNIQIDTKSLELVTEFNNIKLSLFASHMKDSFPLCKVIRYSKVTLMILVNLFENIEIWEFQLVVMLRLLSLKQKFCLPLIKSYSLTKFVGPYISPQCVQDMGLHHIFIRNWRSCMWSFKTAKSSLEAGWKSWVLSRRVESLLL